MAVKTVINLLITMILLSVCPQEQLAHKKCFEWFYAKERIERDRHYDMYMYTHTAMYSTIFSEIFFKWTIVFEQ